jgi:hypothetical protein
MTMVVMPDGVNDPAQGIIAITPGSTPLPNGTCKGIVCGTAGTLNGIDEVGNVFTGFPLAQGYNRLRLAQVTSGGTAANLWALY